MKTSFYFVLWFVIYPILGQFNNSFIDNNAFVIALAIVWGLSWLLNKIMPKTLAYERATQVFPILENVYTGNVASFKKRLARRSYIEVITAIYFSITTLVIAIAVIKFGINDWISLAIFLFFTIATVSRSSILLKATMQLKGNPTPEQCMEIVDETYKLDYNSYFEMRSMAAYDEIFPPKPTFFKVFIIFSIIIAIIVAFFGLYLCIIDGFVLLTFQTLEIPDEELAFAGMYFLYGTLAAYYGIKDIISCIRSY